MKISELIEQLQKLKELHGDVEVYLPRLTGDGEYDGTEHVSVSSASYEDFPIETLSVVSESSYHEPGIVLD